MPADPDVVRGAGNIAAVHEAIAEAVASRPCLIVGDVVHRWAEVTERTRRLAHGLLAAGVGGTVDADPAARPPWESPHDHVALFLTNGAEYLEAMLGSWKARAVSVNVNYRYTAAELVPVFRASRPAAVVYHRRFAPVLADGLERADIAAPRLLVVVDDGDSGVEPLPGSIDYETLLAGAADGPVALDWPDDDRYLVFTGGTTGDPKGVLWRQGDFLATALGIDRPLDDLVARAARPDRPRALPAPPFMHGAAHWNALSCWLGGGTVVVPSVADRLDAHDLLDTCARHDVTSLLIVGDAFARPLIDAQRERPRALPALRTVMSGGAVLSPAVRAGLLDAFPGVGIVDLLGSSESGNHGRNVIDTDDGASRGVFTPGPATVLVTSGRDRFLDRDEDADVGPAGWLATRGRVPLGYLGDPEASEATFPTIAGERCSVAGDRARWRRDGRLELLGRGSGTINSGGEKIHAEEVEMAVKEHSDVYDALVVGVPDPRWGQRVVAVVALQPDAVLAPSAIDAAAGAVVARFKVPKAYVEVDAIRRSASGKPDYAWAREVAGAASSTSADGG